MLILTVGFVLLAGTLASKYDCNNNPVTNGCSVKDFASYNDIFAPDCHRHDVCYACGTKVNLSRKQCDEMFHEDLRDSCKTDRRAGWFCNFWARIYYWAVRMFGKSHYNNYAKRWCNHKEYGHEPCLTQ